MKRTLIASILGIAASVASSYGQGQVIFNTYLSSTVYAGVVWGNTSATPAPGHTLGTPIVGSDNFTATLYYGIGSGLAFSALTPVAGSATPVGTLFPGAIVGGGVTLPAWSAGNSVTFGIHFDNGAGGYASADTITWTEPASTIVAVGNPANNFTQALLLAAYPNGNVSNPVPEPTTMALAGLGAAAMLIFRRRQ